MNKSYYIILISVFVFIATNTIFYVNIYQRQANFQTELLTQQLRICGNIIENRGMSFENEVNFILFSDDITQLFRDSEVKQIGSKNLELFYSKYADLINKITIYDSKKNVYGLILDKKSNFVSDYYESQRQISLQDRDLLYFENGKSLFTIPIFRDNEVHSNILIEIDFNRYFQSVFDQYNLENTLWQWLITEEGEVDTTIIEDLRIPAGQLKRIGDDIFEGNEGSLVHTIGLNGESMKVISVYYPVRLIRRDYGIAFSMKTDLFLQSIYLKTIVITIASLILLGLILFVHFRIVKGHARKSNDHGVSEHALFSSINQIPAGIIIVNSDDTIRLVNQAALELLFLNTEDNYTGENVDKLNLGNQVYSDYPVYNKVFGKGHVQTIARDNFERILYKNDWHSIINQDEVRFIMLFDITHFEKSRKLEVVAQTAKSGLLDNMKQEMAVPINSLRQAIINLDKSKAKGSINKDVDTIIRSVELLENLINANLDFSSLEPDKMVVEAIPYNLREEINLAIEPFKNTAHNKNINIVTKIRNDIPEKLVGDPFGLKQVFNNLLENAFETTHEGRILISAEFILHQFDSIRIKVNIEDTGTGYSGDILDELFEHVHQGKENWKEQYGETGLRLAVAKQHIDLMKGSIQIESPSSISTNPKYPGTNCTFFFEGAPDDILLKKLDFTEIKSFPEIECLVLAQTNDPDETSYRILEEMGVTVNHRIYRNNNLETVSQYLHERNSDIHILFIIDKPGYDGFILASELFEQGLSRNFYIVMVSSNNLPGNYLRSKNYMVDLHLAEPFESNTIFEFIKARFTAVSDIEFQKAPKGIRISSNTSILLADDNFFNRKLAQSLFKNIGFEIDLAENGNEVLEMVKAKQYDIIFMDLLMPVIDGLQAAEELRKLGHKMPIIALTAVEPEKSKAAAEAVGINEYLIKPASIEIIREILLRSFSEKA